MTTPTPPLPTRRWLKPDEAALWLGLSDRQFARAGFSASYHLGTRSPRYDVDVLHKEMTDGISRDAKEQDAGDTVVRG